MTIRYTCDKCGSVLKIKDELAGTDGKCPKCKTRFVVPPPSPEAPVETATPSHKSLPKITPGSPPRTKTVAAEFSSSDSIPASKPQTKAASKPPEKPATKAPAKAADDDEFDPVSFLMEGPRKKPTFEPDEEDAPPSRSKYGSSSSRSGGGRGFSLDDDLDDDGDSPPPPTRKWGSISDSDSSADRPVGNSRNVAQDLLSRSMEESRVRASEMPEAKPRFDFDFAGFFREIGLKSIGGVVGILLAAYGVYWAVDSMVGAKVKIPPLGYVSGTVTIKGKPVPGIKVYFSPLEREIPGANDRKERARDSMGITDEKGNFVMFYLPDHAGAKVGPCRLWLESLDPSVSIPPKYGLGSVHQLEVKPGANEHQKIEL